VFFFEFVNLMLVKLVTTWFIWLICLFLYKVS
jgi:hypothetical protein